MEIIVLADFRRFPGLQECLSTIGNALEGARILINGGTGFVGHAILRALDLTANPSLEVWVASRRRPTLALDVLYPDLAPAWIPLDVARSARFGGPYDIVIHAATSSSASRALGGPLATVDTILQGTRNLIDWALSQPQRVRIVFLSSGAVYGLQPSSTAAISETWPGAPLHELGSDGYAEAKRMGECMLELAGRSGALDFVAARLFAFVGPSLPINEHFAIGNFIGDALAGRNVFVAGTGRPIRSYLYELDMAAWILAAALWGDTSAVYNVGSSRGQTILSIAGKVAEIAGVGVTCAGDSSRDGDRMVYVPDVTRAQESLGVAEWTSLESAIRATISAHQTWKLRPNAWSTRNSITSGI